MEVKRKLRLEHPHEGCPQHPGRLGLSGKSDNPREFLFCCKPTSSACSVYTEVRCCLQVQRVLFTPKCDPALSGTVTITDVKLSSYSFVIITK